MKIQKYPVPSIAVLLLLLGCVTVFSQTPGLLKRTTYKSDRLDFGVGGTLVVVGAPQGSIKVVGWSNNEIEINATIELQAATEQDLAALAGVTGFVLEESLGRTAIISVGTHDKKGLKKAGAKLPKKLFGLPFRIDYEVKVPQYCDLQIDGGSGDLTISGIEGTMKINYLNTNAKMALVGGSVTATFGAGNVDIVVPVRNWRGRFADVQLATGNMNIYLPPNLSSEIDAVVLRTGGVENAFTDFKPRSRNVKFTEKSIIAKSGNGGIPLKFTVGDGTLKLLETPKPQ
jgi:hypothetical protein